MAKTVDIGIAERLRAARIQAGYSKPTDAAKAFDLKSTYYQHENGTRPIGGQSLERYAKIFRVDEAWLRFGDGKGDVQRPSSPVTKSTGAHENFNAEELGFLLATLTALSIERSTSDPAITPLTTPPDPASNAKLPLYWEVMGATVLDLLDKGHKGNLPESIQRCVDTVRVIPIRP